MSEPLASVPSPRGPEMVFHDPLADLVSEQRTESRGASFSPFRASPKANRFEAKRQRRRLPASRADAIDAVSRELELLARRRGNPLG
jgi:hypothetical protein